MLNELIEKMQKMLNEDSIWAEVYQYNGLPVIAVDIDWGDWKHDHLRCDWLVKSNMPELTYFTTKTTETDGSDCYSGTHYYVLAK